MLSVTREAAGAMVVAIERASAPEDSGVRISHDPRVDAEGRSPRLRLDVVNRNAPGDETVVAPGGLWVYVEAEVAPLLEDKILDGDVTEDGITEFRIVDRAR